MQKQKALFREKHIAPVLIRAQIKETSGIRHFWHCIRKLIDIQTCVTKKCILNGELVCSKAAFMTSTEYKSACYEGFI